MNENNKNIFIYFSIILGVTILFAVFEKWKYAVPVFIFFPLSIFFFFKNYLDRPLGIVMRFVYGLLFLIAGIYYMLRIKSIL